MSPTTKQIIAIASVIIGGGFIYAGTQETEKKRAYTFYGIGIGALAISFSIYLSSLASPKASMKDAEANEALKGLLDKLSSQLTISCTVKAFRSAEDCALNDTKSDLIFGYDIENLRDKFMELRTRVLEAGGDSVMVTKHADSKNTNLQRAVLTSGKGPYSFFDEQIEFDPMDVTTAQPLV